MLNNTLIDIEIPNILHSGDSVTLIIFSSLVFKHPYHTGPPGSVGAGLGQKCRTTVLIATIILCCSQTMYACFKGGVVLPKVLSSDNGALFCCGHVQYLFFPKSHDRSTMPLLRQMTELLMSDDTIQIYRVGQKTGPPYLIANILKIP